MIRFMGSTDEREVKPVHISGDWRSGRGPGAPTMLYMFVPFLVISSIDCTNSSFHIKPKSICNWNSFRFSVKILSRAGPCCGARNRSQRPCPWEVKWWRSTVPHVMYLRGSSDRWLNLILRILQTLRWTAGSLCEWWTEQRRKRSLSIRGAHKFRVPGRPCDWTVMPNICGRSVWHLFNVSLPVPRILRLLLHFVQFFNLCLLPKRKKAYQRLSWQSQKTAKQPGHDSRPQG